MNQNEPIPCHGKEKSGFQTRGILVSPCPALTFPAKGCLGKKMPGLTRYNQRLCQSHVILPHQGDQGEHHGQSLSETVLVHFSSLLSDVDGCDQEEKVSLERMKLRKKGKKKVCVEQQEMKKSDGNSIKLKAILPLWHN